MPTLIATAGAANANSFVTVAEADAYLDQRRNVAAWTAAATDDKERALIEATRTISLLPFVGWRTTGTQALSWPREEAENPDAPYLASETTFWFPDTVVPQRVKDATCEMAAQLLALGATDLTAFDPNRAVITKTVGPLSTTYADPASRPQGIVRFPMVLDLLRPLLSGDGSGLTVVRV